jgi:hypothetical protein
VHPSCQTLGLTAHKMNVALGPISTQPLHHYTSLDGMLGIVRNKCLWATHIAHLNDSTELDYAVELLRGRINQTLWEDEPAADDRKCLEQLLQWLGNRELQNTLLFTCSFSEEANLLSQWRAYCPASGGVSLGFDAAELLAAADSQAFQLTRCVYQPEEQRILVEAWLREVLATKADKEEPPSQAHPTQSFFAHFRSYVTGFLQIAARIKNPCFSEEKEWRLVSGGTKSLKDPKLQFRAGKSRLIPYVEFTPPTQAGSRLSLRTVYVGPAQDPNLSFESIATFLTHSDVRVSKGIRASGIPLRSW